ncbi:MAG: DinB family protein [Acidimicrobiales bacterium]
MEKIPTIERPEPLRTGSERDQLNSWLAYHRSTLLWKCAGLTTEELSRQPVATSTMSLLGMIRHMTFVEQVWFEKRFAGNDVVPYYERDDDPDADFNDLASATLYEVVANFRHACERTDELIRGHGLDEVVKAPGGRRDSVDLRWIYLHMIEEYARHCGHADIFRELIDGATGD